MITGLTFLRGEERYRRGFTGNNFDWSAADNTRLWRLYDRLELEFSTGQRAVFDLEPDYSGTSQNPTQVRRTAPSSGRPYLTITGLVPCHFHQPTGLSFELRVTPGGSWTWRLGDDTENGTSHEAILTREWAPIQAVAALPRRNEWVIEIDRELGPGNGDRVLARFAPSATNP